MRLFAFISENPTSVYVTVGADTTLCREKRVGDGEDVVKGMRSTIKEYRARGGYSYSPILDVSLRVCQRQ